MSLNIGIRSAYICRTPNIPTVYHSPVGSRRFSVELLHYSVDNAAFRVSSSRMPLVVNKALLDFNGAVCDNTWGIGDDLPIPVAKVIENVGT